MRTEDRLVVSICELAEWDCCFWFRFEQIGNDQHKENAIHLRWSRVERRSGAHSGPMDGYTEVLRKRGSRKVSEPSLNDTNS